MTIGILLITIVLFSAIAVYNVFVYKIPVFDLQKSTALPELNAVSRPVTFTDIAADDPVRSTLLTDDEAWAYSWAFLHDKIGFSVFMPMEKRGLGLYQVTDDHDNQYYVWGFSVKQQERPLLIFPRFTLGGEVFIDAQDGQVLWYASFI